MMMMIMMSNVRIMILKIKTDEDKDSIANDGYNGYDLDYYNDNDDNYDKIRIIKMI